MELRCRDVGLACSHATKADDEDTLLARVREHARDQHGVELTDTLVDYARTQVRTGGS